MDFDVVDLLLAAALLIAAVGLLAGLWVIASARAHERQVTVERDLQTIRARYAHFQALAGSTAEQVKDHRLLVEAISARMLAARDENDGLPQEVIVAASVELLTANEQLRESLAQAESKIEYYAHQAATNLQQSRTDALTGVANRRAFNDELTAGYAAWINDAQPLALLLIDVDHFKRLNDMHGHQAGDHVLRGIASLLSSAARPEHRVARYGGEEFAVILPSANLAEAQQTARKMRAAIAAATFYSASQALRATVSIGVAELAAGGDSATLLQCADRALYAAKENGRNRVYRCDGEQCHLVDAPTIESPARIPSETPQPQTTAVERRRERRRQPRRPFPFVQLVARVQPGSFPGADEFVPVQFQELSVNGCSFLLETAPDAEAYVVALGIQPSPIYVIAQVVYSLRRANDEELRYVVGCEFTKRIRPGTVDSILEARARSAVSGRSERSQPASRAAVS